MKTNPDQLIEEIADDFSQFLKQGNLNLKSFLRKIEPNLRIDDIKTLLRIHFVLTSKEDDGAIGVLDFLEQLPGRLRRIKTTIRAETEILEGEVKGRINWNKTIKQRCQQNPDDKTSFVCEKREKDYDIPENLVLKILLQIIHDIVSSDLEPAFKEKHHWLRGWLTKDKDLRQNLDQILFKNIYLKRMDSKKPIVTDRMISRASSSRIQLYKDAALLLYRYNKLMAYELDSCEAKELLKNTFIMPEREEVIFELYWIIKIVKKLAEEPRFQLIDKDSNMIAIWKEGEYTYKIYHDTIGDFKFIENLLDISKNLENKNNYLGRELKVLEKFEKMVGIRSDNLWGGRPDILLEKFDKADNLISVFLGEVKYTDARNYAFRGLKELLDYIALIKKDGEYVEEYDNLFVRLEKVSGALFTDRIKELNVEIEDGDKVQIIMYGDNLEKLKPLM